MGNEVALMTASKKENLKLIKYLLSKGAELQQNEDEIVKMAWANECDDVDIILFFMHELKVDIHPYKNSLLSTAQLSNNPKIYTFLEKSFDDNLKNLH